MPKLRCPQLLSEVSELLLKPVELKSVKSVQSVCFRAEAVECGIRSPSATWDAVWCPRSAYRTDKYLAGQLDGLQPCWDGCRRPGVYFRCLQRHWASPVLCRGRLQNQLGCSVDDGGNVDTQILVTYSEAASVSNSCAASPSINLIHDAFAGGVEALWCFFLFPSGHACQTMFSTHLKLSWLPKNSFIFLCVCIRALLYGECKQLSEIDQYCNSVMQDLWITGLLIWATHISEITNS